MNVLVTGATGFLGSHIAEQLSAAGHRVVALVRRTSNTKFLSALPGVDLVQGSVEDLDSVRKAMQGVQAVIHAAGLIKAQRQDEFFAVNERGTLHMLTAAREVAPALARFVLVSSLAAVGPSLDGRPVPGNGDRRPITHYGRSKSAGEDHAVAAKDDLPIVILRPPMIYGPRDPESFAFFQSVSRRFLPYLGDGTNTMSVIYASDAAEACIQAIKSDVPSGSSYFIDDGQVYVWREMLEDIERALGTRALVRFGVPFFAFRGAAMLSEGFGKLTGKAVLLTRDKVNELAAPHWVCDSADTRRDLAWTPKVSWGEGTRRAVQWYRENGWL